MQIICVGRRVVRHRCLKSDVCERFLTDTNEYLSYETARRLAFTLGYGYWDDYDKREHYLNVAFTVILNKSG